MLPFGVAVDDQIISIHALREEGDSGYAVYQVGSRGISIHALREEGDMGGRTQGSAGAEFLSTPSARRATGVPGG